MFKKLGSKRPLWEGPGEGTPNPNPDPSTTTPPTPEPPQFDLSAIELDAFKGFIPQDYQLDEGLANEFLSLVNSGASRAAIAEGSVKLFMKAQEATEVAIVNGWQQTQSEWTNALKNDPEVGGEKLETSLATAKELIRTYGGQGAQELEGLLDLTGLGNNVHVVKLLNALAAAVPKEGTPVGGDPTPTDKTRAQKLFTS